MQLAHLGAEVIRLESQGRSDAARRLPILPVGMEHTLNRSGRLEVIDGSRIQPKIPAFS